MCSAHKRGPSPPMGSPPAVKSKATAMPPQIMTGATHLWTEDTTFTTQFTGITWICSVELCRTCLMKRMYKKAITSATKKPLQMWRRFIQSVCSSVYACVCVHSHKQPIPRNS